MSSTALRGDEWYNVANQGNELAPSNIKPVPIARPQLSSPTVVHESKWAKPTIDRLVALARLRDNWDQRGSAAVRADVLEFAWNVLANIMPEDGKPPVIVPIGNGGIQLEWSSESADLEIDIARPFHMTAFLYPNDGDGEGDEEIPTDTWDCLTEVVQEHFRT